MLTTSSTLYCFSRSYSSCITGNISLLSNFPFPFPPSPWQSPFSLFLWFVYYACMCVCVCVYACTHTRSVMFYPLQLHELQPARLLCPWSFPGKNTGVGGHFLLQVILLTQELSPHLLRFLHCQADSLSLYHLHDFDYFRHLT